MRTRSPDAQSILHNRAKGARRDHFGAQRGGAYNVVVNASIGLGLVERWLRQTMQLRRVTQRKQMPIESLSHGRLLGQLAMHTAALVDHVAQFAGAGLQACRLQQCVAERLGGHGAGTHRFGASMPESGGAARLVGAHVALKGLTIGQLKRELYNRVGTETVSLARALIKSPVTQHIHIERVHNARILRICSVHGSPRGIIDLEVQGAHIDRIARGAGVWRSRRDMRLLHRIPVDLRQVTQHSDTVAPRVLEVHRGRSICAD